MNAILAQQAAKLRSRRWKDVGELATEFARILDTIAKQPQGGLSYVDAVDGPQRAQTSNQGSTFERIEDKNKSTVLDRPTPGLPDIDGGMRGRSASRAEVETEELFGLIVAFNSGFSYKVFLFTTQPLIERADGGLPEIQSIGDLIAAVSADPESYVDHPNVEDITFYGGENELEMDVGTPVKVTRIRQYQIDHVQQDHNKKIDTVITRRLHETTTVAGFVCCGGGGGGAD